MPGIMVGCRRSWLGPACTRKNGIENVYSKDVEVLMGSFQKYESHFTYKSVRHDRYADDRPTRYQEVAEQHCSSSITVSWSASSDKEAEDDKMFGRRFKTRRYDSQNGGRS